jgi:hypothetical protein
MPLQLSSNLAAIFLLSGCGENGQSRVQLTVHIYGDDPRTLLPWTAVHMAVALVVGSLLLGCARPVGPPTRPDGTPFESHAELMQYLKEHPEEQARIDP